MLYSQKSIREDAKFKKAESKKERTVESAWLFDVDGVLTNLQAKEVLEKGLFAEVINRLKVGEPVAFNTGRDLGFVNEKFIKPLQEQIDKKLLKNLFAVAEKGALWANFGPDGMEKENIDKNISVPDIIKNRVRDLVKEKFSDWMFYDETKQTMISVEMVHGGDIREFGERREEFLKYLKNILKELGGQDKYIIDANMISTDIQSVEVGKNLGARRFLGWLKEKGITVEKFFCFGDSKSDLAMAEEIHRQGGRVQFVFVGDKECVEGTSFGFEVICPKGRYDKGTLDFLKNNK